MPGTTVATPLHLACTNRCLEVVHLLLFYGAEVNAVNDKRHTPLHETCEEGCTDIARLLLEHGADPNAMSKAGTTALRQACMKGHVELIAGTAIYTHS